MYAIRSYYVIPMGIAITYFAGPEFWQAIGHAPSEFADLTFAHFIVNNLIPVTLGNIIGGGLFVGSYNFV